MAQQLAEPPRADLAALARLPLVDTLLDLDSMQARIRGLAPRAGGDLAVTSARLMGYKPGQRAVIAYDLERPSGERLRIMGKHFRDPVQARRVRDMHRALRSHVFRDMTGLGVPKPFGWLPHLALVLYVPAEGPSLDRAIHTGRASVALQRTAEWLVRLHQSRLRLDRRLRLDSELVNVGEWAQVVGAAYPEHADLANRISEHLRERATGLHLRLGSPIHKDFHYRHVVVGKRLTVLDFDEMRTGDPVFDLAHFCTYLYVLGVRRAWPPSRHRMLERVFLDEYARQSSWTKDDRFTYFSAYTCLKIARQLCLHVGVPPRPNGAERRRQVQAILGHGQALAASLA